MATHTHCDACDKEMDGQLYMLDLALDGDGIEWSADLCPSCKEAVKRFVAERDVPGPPR
jgi:hypothetical protein